MKEIKDAPGVVKISSKGKDSEDFIKAILLHRIWVEM